MKEIFRKLSGCIKNNYEIFLGVFSVLYIAMSAMAIKVYCPGGAMTGALISVPVFFILLETAIRVILYLAFGAGYRYFLYSYYIVDDERYGNAFRKGCYSKKIKHLIFDTFVFPPKTGEIFDTGDNIAKRNDFNVNSLGYRGPEFDTRKQRGKLRIFCSGGSTTACNSVDDDETWPAYLEKELKIKGYNVEVMNAGVQAWFSYQEYLRFRDEISGYGADVVLFHEGWNEEFEYSSLSLGEKWKSRVARSAREENDLYSPPNRLVSGASILSLYLAAQVYYKKMVFRKKMRFDNPARWEMLLATEYLAAWFDNLADSMKIAGDKGILLYTIDAPCLVNIGDTPEERGYYVANSRLTPLFAEYQAISKKRISRFLAALSPLIPCIDVDGDMKKYKLGARSGLFIDEIHTSREGNLVFARALADKLSGDKRFNDKARGISPSGAQYPDEGVILSVKREALKNSPYLEGMVLERKYALEDEARCAQRGIPEIPQDRYTTF